MAQPPYPKDRKYTQEHEWAKEDGGSLLVGITDHAQAALGDVVYVELPAVGRVLAAHETFGVVESIKAVSDLYSPLAGKVVAVNDPLREDPSAINRDPHGAAWLIKLAPSDMADARKLMDASQYEAYVATLK